VIWGKWFWSDWLSDPELRACSFGARGLWMDLLCVAAQANPVGHLVLNGRALTTTDMQRIVGGDASEIETLLAELESNGVYSKTRKGILYSRRIVRDAKKAEIARKNGKKGGNPSLGKNKEIPASDNHPDKGGHNTQKLEARSQIREDDVADERGTRDQHDEILIAAGVDPSKDITGRWHGSEQLRIVDQWRGLPMTQAEILTILREVRQRGGPPKGSLGYFSDRMCEFAGQRDAPPLQPSAPVHRLPTADRPHRTLTPEERRAAMARGREEAS
jgi:hypothetical protein